MDYWRGHGSETCREAFTRSLHLRSVSDSDTIMQNLLLKVHLQRHQPCVSNTSTFSYISRTTDLSFEVLVLPHLKAQSP